MPQGAKASSPPVKLGSSPSRGTDRPTPRKAALEGLEKVQDVLSRELGRTVKLSMGTPERGRGRTTWAVKGTFTDLGRPDYKRLAKALARIEDASAVERALGRRTYARVSVTYNGPRKRGKPGVTQREWTVGEIAPWEVSLARAGNAVRFAARDYETSWAKSLSIWISTDEAPDRDFDDGGDIDAYRDED